MDFEKEFLRISETIAQMPMEEFEEMLIDCGFGSIRPSAESFFVKCVNNNFFEIEKNYISQYYGYQNDNYKHFNNFDDLDDIDGQGVA